jgi:tripartite-type tricarboxylate transporter receptor subunit TctC
MPNMQRRFMLVSLGLTGVAMVMKRPAFAASNFPDRDIAFVIPDGPGGGFDSYVRAISPAMEKYLPHKATIVPTNVPGAGGARAATQIYHAKPDGYMIGIFNVPGIYIKQERGNAGFDLEKFTWLGRVGINHYGLAVGENSPIKSMADLKALSKKRPVKFTSTGPAGTAYNVTQIAAHLLGIRAEMITGYKGSRAYVMGAVRGDGDAVVTVIPTLRRMAAGNTLRILATFEDHSSVPGAADATTLGESELANLSLQRLVAGPPGMPADVKAALAGAMAKALADPAVTAWAKKTDSALTPATPDQAVAILHKQIAFYTKWKRYLKAKS